MPAADAGDRPRALALGALLLGALAIGSSPIWVRLSEAGPVATAFWRVSLALPFLWLWVAWERAGARRTVPPAGRKGVIGAGLYFAGDLAAWHVSILLTSVAVATLLANLAPIFVTLVGWLWLRERVSGGFVLGLAVALAGVALLIGADFGVGAQALWGDALGIITAMFYAAYLLQVKRLRDQGFSTARIMAWSTLVTALALLPLALVLGEQVLPVSAAGWGVLLGLALASQVAGQSLIAYAFAHLPATLGSVSLLIQPVFAALFAWLLLAEAIGAWQIAGGAAVLAGIRIAHRASAQTAVR